MHLVHLSSASQPPNSCGGLVSKLYMVPISEQRACSAQTSSGRTCTHALLNTYVLDILILRLILNHIPEHPHRRPILHSHNPRPPYRPPRPLSTTNRGDTQSVGRFEVSVGTDRPTGWHHQLPASKNGRRRHERLEFRHVEAARSDREDMDGRERCTGGAGERKGIVILRCT